MMPIFNAGGACRLSLWKRTVPWDNEVGIWTTLCFLWNNGQSIALLDTYIYFVSNSIAQGYLEICTLAHVQCRHWWHRYVSAHGSKNKANKKKNLSLSMIKIIMFLRYLWLDYWKCCGCHMIGPVWYSIVQISPQDWSATAFANGVLMQLWPWY